MRSIVWLAPGAAFAAALAVLVALGSPNGAFAQGMMMGDTPGAKAKPKAAKPKAAKAKTAKPALRGKRAFRPAAVKTCGQFKYWSKGKCLDARTTPPKLK
jgi:hypothetical protein